MDLLRVILLCYFAVGGVYWVAMIYSMIQIVRRVPRLDRVDLSDPEHWPTLSIVMPACNEEDEIKPAVRSLLGLDYPNAEIILIDDRSTDRTGEIMDSLAREDTRLKVIHITALPEGWLGKVHALHRGTLAASGEWLLFSDGDVKFKPDALKRAIGFALSRGLDHVAAMPGLLPSGIVLESMIATFLRQLGMALRLWKVNDPSSGAFMGVGAFNLVRREALDKTAGFEWLKFEVGDDVGLAMMLRRSGARTGLISACEYLHLHWYRTIGQMTRGAERGFASVGRCSPLRTVLVGLIGMALELSMFVALIPMGLGPLPYVACGFLTAFVTASWLTCRWSETRLLPMLLAPLAAVISAAIGVRSALVGRRRGGIVWRGTLYRCDALRAGARLKL